MAENNNNQNYNQQADNRVGPHDVESGNILDITLNSSQLGRSFLEGCGKLKRVVHMNFTKVRQELDQFKANDQELYKNLNNFAADIEKRFSEVEKVLTDTTKYFEEGYNNVVEQINNHIIATYDQRLALVEKEISELKAFKNLNVSFVPHNVNLNDTFVAPNNNLINNIINNQGGNFVNPQPIQQQVNNPQFMQQQVYNPQVVQQQMYSGRLGPNILDDSIRENQNLAGQPVFVNGLQKIYALCYNKEKFLKFYEYAGNNHAVDIGHHKFFFKKFVCPKDSYIIYEVVSFLPGCQLERHVGDMIKEALKDAKKTNRYSEVKKKEYIYKVKFSSSQVQFHRQVNKGDNIKSGFYFAKDSDKDKFIVQNADYWTKKYKNKKNKNKNSNKKKNNNNKNNNYNNYNNRNNNNYNNRPRNNYSNNNYIKNTISKLFGRINHLSSEIGDIKYYGSRGGGSSRGKHY
jgi:hypothetical protein